MRMPALRNKDLSFFIQILQRIHRLQERYWREEHDLSDNSLPKRVTDIYHVMTVSVGYPLKEAELNEFLKAGNGHIAISNLFLPPLELDNEFIPIMNVDCNFDSKPPEIRLCVGMFGLSRNKQPKVFGFRFETGHVNSNHNYCHGQFTRKFLRNSEKFAIFPTWIPEEIPCILVPANDPVSLLCVLLISFYGKRIWNKALAEIHLEDKYCKSFKTLI